VDFPACRGKAGSEVVLHRQKYVEEVAGFPTCFFYCARNWVGGLGTLLASVHMLFRTATAYCAPGTMIPIVSPAWDTMIPTVSLACDTMILIVSLACNRAMDERQVEEIWIRCLVATFSLLRSPVVACDLEIAKSELLHTGTYSKFDAARQQPLQGYSGPYDA
jgi:hypothetical protein